MFRRYVEKKIRARYQVPPLSESTVSGGHSRNPCVKTFAGYHLRRQPEIGIMSRRASTFRQSEVSRAVKGVQQAGVNIYSIELEPTGKIIILISPPLDTTENLAKKWDAE